MNRGATVLLIALNLSAATRLTSQSIPNATSTATIAANPRDVASADAIIAALYDANTVLVAIEAIRPSSYDGDSEQWQAIQHDAGSIASVCGAAPIAIAGPRGCRAARGAP